MKFSKRLLLIASIVFMTSILSACVTTVPMSKVDEQDIKTISISNVEKAHDAFYVGPGMGLWGILGTIASIDEGKRLAKFAMVNKIYIDQIVRGQFIQQLSHTKYHFVEDDKADAKLHIKVSYGLISVYGVSSNFVPLINIQAKAINQNGRIIWQSSKTVSEFTSRMPRHAFSDIKNNPQVLYDSWNAAAEHIVKNMIRTL